MARMEDILKSLCLSYGWSYGIFWAFDPRNHMLLTMEDAYCEEHARSVVDSMLLQVHMLGEGKIGKAALDGKHRWLFLDPSTEKHKCVDHKKEQFASWDASEFGVQFSSGIKTVAVVPVKLEGVVQFGSTKEILETPEFLGQARRSLQDKDHFAGLMSAGTASFSLNSDANAQTGLLPSMISSQNSLYGDVSTSWANLAENMTLSSTFDPLAFSGETFEGKSRDRCGDGELFIDPDFGSFFDQCQMDDLSQWLADSSRLCVPGLDTTVSNDMTQPLGVDCMPPDSLSNALNACGERKSLDAPLDNDEQLTKIGVDFGCGKLGACLEDVINWTEDIANPLPLDNSFNISHCISGMQDSSVAVPKKALFSELGLEHLLKDSPSCSSITRSCIDDQWPTSKKRKVENHQTIYSQIHIDGHPLGVKEFKPKSQSGLWMDESYSTDAKSCISGVNAQTKRPEEPVKPNKKRAKPGESTRPRPKDRQMIADRIKELRDLIPNGSKLSIDALLGRTIKHMIFMQSLTKHADKLKQVDEPKIIGQDNSLAHKGSGGSGSRGATWAYEVGGTNLFCPIIVEDLNRPGQMLIEMLCEERGYFLEIVDVVRGFGLTILKGVMESRDDKIWAHFIVEGNRHVTRMDVFVSLMQLLQGTTLSTSEVNTRIEPAQVVNDSVHAPLWSNYHHQHAVALPI